MKIEKTKKNIWVSKGTANFGKPSISAIGVKDYYFFSSDGDDVNITFNNRGGYATSWSISPNVPNNLTFDKNSGKIVGKTTDRLTGLSFKVTAKNGYGTNSENVTLNKGI